MKTIITFILLALLTQDLTAQEIRIPYRKGELWGLADTNGQIIITPKYKQLDYTHFYGNIAFLVEDNNGKGLLSNDEILIPTEYVYIGFGYNHCIIAEKTDTKDFYNLKGELLLSGLTYYKSIYINGHRFCIVRRKVDEKIYHSAFWFNKETGQIDTFLLKDVEDITWSHEYDFISGTTFDGQEITYEIVRGDKKPTLKLEKKKVLTSRKLNYGLEEYPPMEQEEVDELYSYRYIVEHIFEAKEGNIISKREIFRNIGSSMGEPVLEILKNKRRTTYEIVPYVQLTRAYVDAGYMSKDTMHTISNFVISKKKKKYGLITENFTLQPQFDSIVGYSRERQDPFFVGYRFDKKFKKTVLTFIDVNGKPLETDNQLIESFEFKQMGNFFFFTSISGEKGVYHYNRAYTKVLPIEYDELEYVYGVRFYFVKDGKRGLSSYYKIEVPAIFDGYPQKVTYFNQQYKVWYITDKSRNGKFLGYGDLKGFNYYED